MKGRIRDDAGYRHFFALLVNWEVETKGDERQKCASSENKFFCTAGQLRGGDGHKYSTFILSLSAYLCINEIKGK